MNERLLASQVRESLEVPGQRADVINGLFEDLYRRHLADIFRYALVLTRNTADAEDVASETFVRALRAWRRGQDPDGPALPWLLSIARNLATDRWRRAKRTFGFLPAPTAPTDADHSEALMWLEGLSRILPARQREVLALRYQRELRDADIAGLMGLSESGVRSLVARAIENLRQHPEVWR
jgi:RNA polymerase sigma-70 factor (ECF subfamily)